MGVVVGRLLHDWLFGLGSNKMLTGWPKRPCDLEQFNWMTLEFKACWIMRQHPVVGFSFCDRVGLYAFSKCVVLAELGFGS